MPLRLFRGKEFSDEEILEKFKVSDDMEWLGRLYKRYMQLVYGVCLKYFKDRERASDGVMDIFEKLVQELPRNDVKNFKSWLYVVTKNYCLMTIRHDKSVQNKVDIFRNEQLTFMENQLDWHPFENNGNDIPETALLKCIENLKEHQKRCVEMFYMEKRCYNEISGELHIEIKKVKSHIQNGKRMLKICIDNAYDK